MLSSLLDKLIDKGRRVIRKSRDSVSYPFAIGRNSSQPVLTTNERKRKGSI
jgi:hypothetical protein